jgi:hypothetical protein
VKLEVFQIRVVNGFRYCNVAVKMPIGWRLAHLFLFISEKRLPIGDFGLEKKPITLKPTHKRVSMT